MVTYPSSAVHATPCSTWEQDQCEELQGLETRELIPETKFYYVKVTLRVCI